MKQQEMCNLFGLGESARADRDPSGFSADQQAGNVVVSASFFGGVDEARTDFFGSLIVCQQRGNGCIGKLAGKAAGTEQKEVSRLGFKAEYIGRDAALRT